LNKYYKINQNIKAVDVRVIGPDGDQLGVMHISDALAKAQSLGLDLIEVTDKAVPPIVKIIDFQKFRYQEEKKQKAGSSKGGQETKEVRFTPFMAENDRLNKVKQAREFLTDGDRVKLVVKFHGRQITKKEFGDKIMNSTISDLSDVSDVVELPKYLGKMFIAQIKPKK
jgi:translation initiation factor IF-3